VVVVDLALQTAVLAVVLDPHQEALEDLVVVALHLQDLAAAALMAPLALIYNFNTLHFNTLCRPLRLVELSSTILGLALILRLVELSSTMLALILHSKVLLSMARVLLHRILRLPAYMEALLVVVSEAALFKVTLRTCSPSR
jgi:hypothetical protein